MMNPHPPGLCGKCGLKERLLLHRLWISGMSQCLCTSCVLLLHPSSFCPFCFEFFDHPLSSSVHRFVSCTKCSSLTHLSCLPSPPPSPFLCPPCSQPNNFSFIDSNAPLDKRRALILLCSSKVASSSLAKSLSLARTRVDRTVREAALARKRARDSLDHCSILHKINRLGLQGTFHLSNHNHNNLLTNHKDNGFVAAPRPPSLNKTPNNRLL